MTLPAYEKLGAFYLGRRFDPASGSVTEDLVLYDSKDLTTHAVCVGMTGSGKTGLCISLLEEAAIDGIPAIAIDPKGDLGNLLLTFPDLRAQDFRPWIDESLSVRKGLTPDEDARRTAQAWREGLAAWGQDGERIERLRSSVDLAIYTPGSDAGMPLSILRSLDAPPAALRDDAEALRDRVQSAAGGILTLLGLDADPLRSRESILLATIIDREWRDGRSVDLPSLIRSIQEPPFAKVGVLDLESFFPASKRFELAMALNNLLASPGFAGWLEGEPLDIQRLLWTREGKPRLSVISIAHLGDAERMFVVAAVLSELVSWMRGQSGSGSLRAILYMDEIFGYFPPTANPPSKPPMLTLLKQARAYGLGVVLATQNPVDLDYKGLANAGTWFLGRLQTERDKARVLDGLEAASAASGAGFDRRRLDEILGGLSQRVFLMSNAHEDAPELFQTRWALSYLRGPLTRAQIKALTDPRRAAAGQAAAAVSGAAAPGPAAPVRVDAGGDRPVLPPGIRERLLAPRVPVSGGDRIVYRPGLLSRARLRFVDAKRKVDAWEETTFLAELPAGEVPDDPWDEAVEVPGPGGSGPEAAEALQAPAGATFAPLPAAAARPQSYPRWSAALATRLQRTRVLRLHACPALGETSRPGESESDFRVRISQRAREERDRQVERLRAAHAPKVTRLRDRIRQAEERVAREDSQYRQQKQQTFISIGAGILGALLGRKALSAGNIGRAASAARGVGRAGREKEDVDRARAAVGDLAKEIEALERSLEEEIVRVGDLHRPDALEIESVEVPPRKADASVSDPALAWIPWRVSPDGLAAPALGP